MPKKFKLFNAEMILKITELLESGITVDNACKKLGVCRRTFDANLRKLPELKEVYNRTMKIRRSKPQKICESELNASVSNLGYKDPLLALTEFKQKFQEEKRALTLKSLKDPYS